MINGKTVCTSRAMYSTSTVKMADGMDASAIMGMSRCLDRIEVKKGDKLSLTAHYDLEKHPMRTSNSGEKETVMGLGIFEFVLPVDSAYP
jgi:hypothetical protein